MTSVKQIVSEQDPKQIRGRFQKGQSGNPGGRPKVALAWKERCRRFMEEQHGWEKLAALTDTPDDPGVSLQALKMIAEYAYGKPQQHVDVSQTGRLVVALSNVDIDLV